MDNATIHKYKPWLLIFQFIGVRIVKLPPYSPFLNIIELFFNMVKQLLQRNHFITKTNPYISTILAVEHLRNINLRPALESAGYAEFCSD